MLSQGTPFWASTLFLVHIQLAGRLSKWPVGRLGGSNAWVASLPSTKLEYPAYRRPSRALAWEKAPGPGASCWPTLSLALEVLRSAMG